MLDITNNTTTTLQQQIIPNSNITNNKQPQLEKIVDGFLEKYVEKKDWNSKYQVKMKWLNI